MVTCRGSDQGHARSEGVGSFTALRCPIYLSEGIGNQKGIFPPIGSGRGICFRLSL